MPLQAPPIVPPGRCRRHEGVVEIAAFHDATAGKTQETGLQVGEGLREIGAKAVAPPLEGPLRKERDHVEVDRAHTLRDEDKSRAKERIFSFRNSHHRWDPKRQRPEPWRLFNAHKRKGESIRVFPLSNWTELDVWLYIHRENIPVVPLYFAKPRPVVERGGTLIMVDDDRLPLEPGEVPQMKNVRFRTLGCYPLTGAVESTATTTEDIIRETLDSRFSERQGRVIDKDGSASMERKKQEGYF